MPLEKKHGSTGGSWSCPTPVGAVHAKEAPRELPERMRRAQPGAAPVRTQPWLRCPCSCAAKVELRPRHAEESRCFFPSRMLMRGLEASEQPWDCAWGAGFFGEVGREGCGGFVVLSSLGCE